MKTSKQKIMIQDFKGKEIFNMENENVKNVINIIKDMNIKDKLRLGIRLTTSDWANILYNRNEIYKKFDIMLKEIDEKYRTTLINFRKYKVVMFTMAKLMEIPNEEQNQVTLYLFNNVTC